MADTETDVERIRRRMLDLEVRVHTLESIAIRSLTLFAGVLLVLGSALPTFTDTREFDPVTTRLLNAPFVAFGSLRQDEDHVAFGVAVGIGFLGLLACVVIAVGICFVQWRRWAGPGSVRTAQVVAWLLLVGMLVPVILHVRSGEARTGLHPRSRDVVLRAGRDRLRDHGAQPASATTLV